MNKRIEQIIESCTYVDSIGVDETVYYSFDKEKFAELIVRECIDCLDKQYVDIPEDADLNDNKTWTSATMNSTVNMCVGKVKQHFGVE